MTRKELVGLISSKLEVKKVKAEEILTTIETSIIEGVKMTGEVKTNLATFKVEEQIARERRNPKTGETFMAEPYKKVKATICKELRKF